MFLKGFKSWIDNWVKRGWKSATGAPVKNAGIIRCISAHLNIRGKMGQKVILEYVKGHSGDTGNDGADLMANQGAIKPQIDERPWEQIEVQLKRQLLEAATDPHTPVAQLTVLAPDNLAEVEAELVGAPAKVRKISEPEAIPSTSKPSSQTKVVGVESPLKARDHSTSLASTSSSTSFAPLPPPTSKEVHSSAASIDAAKDQFKTPSSQKPSAKTSDKSNASPSSITSVIASYAHLSGAKSPMRVLCARPPLVPVEVGDVNLDVS